MQLPGTDGQNYVVETSTDLVNWIPYRPTRRVAGCLFFTEGNVSDPERLLSRAAVRNGNKNRNS